MSVGSARSNLFWPSGSNGPTCRLSYTVTFRVRCKHTLKQTNSSRKRLNWISCEQNTNVQSSMLSHSNWMEMEEFYLPSVVLGSGCWVQSHLPPALSVLMVFFAFQVMRSTTRCAPTPPCAFWRGWGCLTPRPLLRNRGAPT